jgi:cilia- and flagella-associated protein 65
MSASPSLGGSLVGGAGGLPIPPSSPTGTAVGGGGYNDTSMSQSTTNAPAMVLEPKERIKRYGIECLSLESHGDGITFLAGTWRPGGEYIQKLRVRNVATTVKKLKYKLPSTRYFSMAYPEIIILSPGMFKDIDVVFRPVEHDPYDDTIYFKMQEGAGSGGFHVPVRAFIDNLKVSCPFGTDLGYCPTY